MLTQLLRTNGCLVSRGLAMAAVALAAVVVPQRSANAALQLILDGGTSNQLTINDNGLGDGSSLTGTIENIQSNYGGFAISVNVANSNSPGTATSGVLAIETLDVTNNNSVPATLTILTSDTNFTQPGGPLSLMNLQSSVSGTTSGAGATDNLTFQSFSDPANGQPATAVSTAKQSLTLSPSFNNTVNQSWSLGAGGGPYSLANYITLTLSGNATANITGITTATVPEPTFGVIPAIALGLLARRRRSAGNVR